jgi:hypothetical protein
VAGGEQLIVIEVLLAEIVRPRDDGALQRSASEMAQISRLGYRNGKRGHNAELRGIARATVLSPATRNIRQNLAVAFSYNALGIPVALRGLPRFQFAAITGFASAAMAVSSVPLVTNALR